MRSLRPVGVKLVVDSHQSAKSLRSLKAGARRPPTETPAGTAEVLVRDVLKVVLRVLEESPELAQRFSALAGARATAARDPLLIPKAEYARRLSYSVRKLDQLIAAGLPTVGKGRALRIPTEAADHWVTAHLGTATEANELEVAALASARRRAARGSR